MPRCRKLFSLAADVEHSTNPIKTLQHLYVKLSFVSLAMSSNETTVAEWGAA